MTFDNQCLFHEKAFVAELLKYDIYPVYNVKTASGLCGSLDASANKHVNEEYIFERKKIERSNLVLTKTKNNDPKALPR